MDVPRTVVESAVRLASELNADVILALTETGKNCEFLASQRIVNKDGKEVKVIAAASNRETLEKIKSQYITTLNVTMWPRGRVSQANHAIACGLQEGYLNKGENVVCLVGDGFADLTDCIMVLSVTGEEQAAEVVQADHVLTAVVELAFELAAGGPNGNPIGAAFVIGKGDELLGLSRQLLINPFENYKAKVLDRSQWELFKKFASFDGAFLVDLDGTVVAANRYLDAKKRVEIPKGLGTRHLAVASMTAETGSKGITVSGEDGFVRVFENGKITARINPSSKTVECLFESF